MIKRIDIEKFGLFKNYAWGSAIGTEDQDIFDKVNIIYGRNYSGKTTLSRIINSIEEKKIPNNFDGSKFKVTFIDDTSIDQSTIKDGKENYSIRVYNSDFVKNNLGWLYDEEGKIEPFTILGATNKLIEKRLSEIKTELGSIESGSGLLFEQSSQRNSYHLKKQKRESLKGEIDNLLSEKAKEIKNDTGLYNAPIYTIATLRKDIPSALSHGELSTSSIVANRKLLKEEQKEHIPLIQEFMPDFANQVTQVSALLQKSIKPSVPISDLINNSILQEWVRQGIDKHKDLRDTCGFCGKILDKDLWEKLDAHFSKESEELRNEIRQKIDILQHSKKNIGTFLTLKKQNLYASLHERFDFLLQEWASIKDVYCESIEKLVTVLTEREKDIFSERTLGDITNVSENILEIMVNINTIIKENNQKSGTLKTDQNNARNALKLSELAKFLTSINYLEKIDLLEVSIAEEEKSKNELEAITASIVSTEEERSLLEAQSKDEKRGAELVNKYLTHFFGHSELKLKAQGESPNILFKVIRHNIHANNLSEGECSLISFCYFIAKIEDELKSNSSEKKLIIYIDDPISSLDNNHIFFMFSLIESVIAKPKKYCQLFISTHNLDFLKYLKQLTFPEKAKLPNSRKKPLDRKYFLIERSSESNTVLKKAPEYLKKYITEFNYLFSQIYRCSMAESQQIEHDYQYNFGNNMRKFLEAYLFYKYPTDKLALDGRIKKFFGSDDVSANLVKRIINEFSHLEDNFDRGIEPVDIEEIKRVSQIVMEKIKSIDGEQFESLVESVSEDKVLN